MYKSKPWTLEKERVNNSKQEPLKKEETLSGEETLIEDIRAFFKNSWKNSYSIEELNKIFKKDTNEVVHFLARNGEINFGISSSGIVYGADLDKTKSVASDTENSKKGYLELQKKKSVKKQPMKIAELIQNYAV